jgi:hypothetical protein
MKFKTHGRNILIYVGSMLLTSLVLSAMVGYAAPGRRICMHDYYMHLKSTGSNRPSVIMDSWLGRTSLDWTQIQTPVAHHHWLFEVPLPVATRGLRESPNTAGDFKEAIWRALQKDMADRSSCSLHLLAGYSGHYNPLERSDAVVNASCIAVETARADTPSCRILSV